MTSSPKSLQPSTPPKPLGLFAGRGSLPRLLLKAASEQGRPVFIVASRGQTDDDLVVGYEHVWLKLGEAGKAMAFFKTNGVQELVMAGYVTRPSLTEIKPDWKGAKWLAKLGTKALGDDDLLSNIIKLLEGEGLKVIGVDDILDSLLAPAGVLTQAHPDEQASMDIKRGQDVLKHLSLADVGQAVIVQQGIVLGVEAIEGTDALIERTASLQLPGPRGILVKQSKWQQERRVDLPTVGPQTIRNLIKAGLRGMAIEADHTLVLQQDEMIQLADEAGLFITAIQGERCKANAHSST